MHTLLCKAHNPNTSTHLYICATPHTHCTHPVHTCTHKHTTLHMCTPPIHICTHILTQHTVIFLHMSVLSAPLHTYPNPYTHAPLHSYTCTQPPTQSALNVSVHTMHTPLHGPPASMHMCTLIPTYAHEHNTYIIHMHIPPPVYTHPTPTCTPHLYVCTCHHIHAQTPK
jgi:hypothetical protein